MIDKFKTCKDCPDRCISPNCHTNCDGYIARRLKFDEINKARIKDNDYIDFRKSTRESLSRFRTSKERAKKHMD